MTGPHLLGVAPSSRCCSGSERDHHPAGFAEDPDQGRLLVAGAPDRAESLVDVEFGVDHIAPARAVCLSGPRRREDVHPILIPDLLLFRKLGQVRQGLLGRPGDADELAVSPQVPDGAISAVDVLLSACQEGLVHDEADACLAHLRRRVRVDGVSEVAILQVHMPPFLDDLDGRVVPREAPMLWTEYELCRTLAYQMHFHLHAQAFRLGQGPCALAVTVTLLRTSIGRSCFTCSWSVLAGVHHCD
ncbi:hypothetical protein [Ktedonospora formicarum]|uniref:hypothetical protein n=1 Tax=Ktedonospora formicarum TaxID=2778364 RepID=UPI001C68B5E7|nr:hypothetical protein [Ktedonospora formicarum]